MAELDSITTHETHIETESHCHRAILVHTGDSSARDLPLDEESIKNASRSSERIRESIREMVGNETVSVNVYQPDKFESPIHECLQRQAYLLVVLSTENGTATTDPKASLETATDTLRYTWNQHFSLGFEVTILKYRQEYVVPLLEDIDNREATGEADSTR